MILQAQRILIALLAAFYGWALMLMLTPRVSEEYRGYYIERSMDEWRPVRYAASIEQGIDFSRPGLPTFLQSLSGVSHHEPWGRWTDARLRKAARLVFEEPFSGEVCVALSVSAAGLQKGKEAIIRAGNKELRFITTSDTQHWYRFGFLLDQPVSALEVEPTAPAVPAAWAPNNTDPRVIGLGLYRLVIAPGNCTDLQLP
jgi:phosphoglycerol transferase